MGVFSRKFERKKGYKLMGCLQSLKSLEVRTPLIKIKTGCGPTHHQNHLSPQFRGLSASKKVLILLSRTTKLKYL